MNDGLQRLARRIQEQDQEARQDYANGLLDACDRLIEEAAEAMVRHEVFIPDGHELALPDRVARLLEARRALRKWRTLIGPAQEPNAQAQPVAAQQPV